MNPPETSESIFMGLIVGGLGLAFLVHGLCIRRSRVLRIGWLVCRKEASPLTFNALLFVDFLLGLLFLLAGTLWFLSVRH